MAWDLTIAGASQITPRRVRAGSLQIVDPINERMTATFEIMSQNLGYAPAIGDEVIITDDDYTDPLFGGEILSTMEEPFGDNIRLLTRVECVGYDVYADRILVTETIEAGYLLSAILTRLVNTYLTPYGVTLHPSQAGGPTFERFVWDHKPLSECLADLTNASGWVRRIDSAKRLRMWNPGDLVASWAVSDADTHSLDLKITRTHEDYANRVYVRWGSGTAILRQVWTVSGSPVPTDFMTDVPMAAGGWAAPVIQIPADGPGGYPIAIEGETVWPWTIEPAASTLHHNSAAFNWPGPPWTPNTDPMPYPLPEGTTIGFSYTAQYPAIAMAEDAADIAAHGLREAVIEAPDIFDADQALALATQKVATADFNRLTLELVTRYPGLLSGQRFGVVLTLRGLNAQFLITTITATVDDDQHWRWTVEGEGGNIYRGSFLDTYRLWSQIGAGGGMGGSSGTALVQQPLPGPIWLGGSRLHTLSASTWTPVVNYQEWFLRGEEWSVARVRACVCASGSPPIAITVRLLNVTTGAVAGELDTPVTDDVFVEVMFNVTIASDWNRYRLEARGLSGSPLEGDSDPIYVIGLIEPLAAGAATIHEATGAGMFAALTGAGAGPPANECSVESLTSRWNDDFSDGDALTVHYQSIDNAETNATCGVGGGWGVRATGTAAQQYAAYFERNIGAQTGGSRFAAEITIDRAAYLGSTWGAYLFHLDDWLEVWQGMSGDWESDDPTALSVYISRGGGSYYIGTATGVLGHDVFQTIRLVGQFSTYAPTTALGYTFTGTPTYVQSVIALDSGVAGTIPSLASGSSGNGLLVSETTKTISVTVASVTDGLLLVRVANHGPGVETITYDGIGLTRIASGASGDYSAEFWYLVDPPVGTADLVVTANAQLLTDEAIFFQATQYQNVDPGTPIVDTNTATGSTSPVSGAPVTMTPGRAIAVDVTGWFGGDAAGYASTTCVAPWHVSAGINNSAYQAGVLIAGIRGGSGASPPVGNGSLSICVDGVTVLELTNLELITANGKTTRTTEEWSTIGFGPMGNGDNVHIWSN